MESIWKDLVKHANFVGWTLDSAGQNGVNVPRLAKLAEFLADRILQLESCKSYAGKMDESLRIFMIEEKKSDAKPYWNLPPLG